MIKIGKKVVGKEAFLSQKVFSDTANGARKRKIDLEGVKRTR